MYPKSVLYPIIAILAFFTIELKAQIITTIPPERRVSWYLAGLQNPINYPTRVFNLLNYGGKNDSTGSNNAAFTRLLTAMGNQGGIIYLPAGTYIFKQVISLPANVVLRGEDAAKTALVFNAPQGGDCIAISGAPVGNKFGKVTMNAARGSSTLKLDTLRGISAGDWIQIIQKNPWETVPATPWAAYSPGQMVKVQSVSGKTLTLSEPLLLNITTFDSAKARKVIMKEGVGIENLRLTRNLGDCPGVPTNINFSFAANCWVKGIESRYSAAAHIMINSSAHLLVTGCYINDGYDFSGVGTRGYGVLIISQSAHCLVENNIFRYLRHHTNIKQGACGNVVAYNYNREPNRSEIPTDWGSDIMFHGFAPTANLYEGNIGMFAQFTQTWGPSGPLNTYFRNRMRTYGIINSQVVGGSDTLQTDSVTALANEITGSGGSLLFPMGNFSFAGYGHFLYANNVQGRITPNASGPINVPEKSLYRPSAPDWWDNQDPWGGIGYPNTYNTNKIPALRRWEAGGILVVPADTQTGYGAACPKPVITVSGPATFNRGDSVTLTSSATHGNKWSTGDTTQSIRVKKSGNYTVQVIVGNCRSQRSEAVKVTAISPFVRLSGKVSTPSGLPVEGVNIMADTNLAQQTNARGNWGINLPGGNSNALSAWKTDDTATRHGLSTYDIILLQRFIQGIDFNPSPYQTIAGDVDKSGKLDGLDISQIRDFVVGNRTDFNGRNWTILNSDYIIRNRRNPFPYDTVKHYPMLSDTLANQNFVALRLGDANGSWNVPFNQALYSAKSVAKISTVAVAPAATFILPVRAASFDTIAGFQFGMDWDPAKLQFIGIVPGALGFLSSNATLAGQGKLGIQWDESSTLGLHYKPDTILFSLKFTVDPSLSSGRIPVNINSWVMQSEVINGKGTLFTQPNQTGYVLVGPSGTEKPVVGDISLSANPNPFSTDAEIDFSLEQAQTVRLDIRNLLGQTVYTSQIMATEGQNRFHWNGKDQQGNILPAGAWFCQIWHKNGTKTVALIKQ